MRQRGTVSTEFALLVPALVLLFGVAVGGARAWLARASVEQIAGAAARGASLERTIARAEESAKKLADAQSRVGGVDCQPLTINTDARVLAKPAGSPGSVSVVIHCVVPLSDVLVPGWPGTMDVSATASAVADRYRERK